MTRVTLAAARVNKGYTQAVAAEKLGINVNTLKSWERGITFPKQPQIEKLCEVYEVTYDELIFFAS